MKSEANAVERAYKDYQKQIKALVAGLNLAREAFVDAFIAERKRRRISLHQAGKMFGVSHSYVDDIEKRRRPLTITIFEKMRKF